MENRLVVPGVRERKVDLDVKENKENLCGDKTAYFPQCQFPGGDNILQFYKISPLGETAYKYYAELPVLFLTSVIEPTIFSKKKFSLTM